MQESIVSYLQRIFNEYPEIITFIISMMPVIELRGAIPVGLSLQLPLTTTLFYSLLGNFIITIPLLYALNKLKEISYLNSFFNWLFNRTRKKAGIVERVKFWGLVVFVGIPLPITGAWTGCVAAYIFDIPIKKALLGIFLGLLLSASIITALIYSGVLIFNIL